MGEYNKMRFVVRQYTPVLVSHTLVRIVGKLFGFSAGAFALFPFVVVRDEKILEMPEYINHESIHIRQYIETAIVGLLFIALFQYLYALFVLRKSRIEAYYYMSHEQEAHQNDTNLSYLVTRPWFAYYKYLLPKNRKRFALVDGKRVLIDIEPIV